MSDIYVLKEYYVRYLKEVRKVKDSTVKHYLDALNYISRYLIEKKRITRSIYEIDDILQLEIVRTYLFNDLYFKELDRRGHQMYSAGLNNYYKFASGEMFGEIKEKICLLDTEVPIKGMVSVQKAIVKRDTIIKKQSIELARYQCEIDGNHSTFIAKSSGHPYMEGHHAIPLNKQRYFDLSLDVYANIVCLCPICHRLLHYGIDAQKKELIDQIYDSRGERLFKSGIRLSKQEFENMAM